MSCPHLLMHKSGKAAYGEYKLKLGDFLTIVTKHEIQ